jgi:hypothetical protein
VSTDNWLHALELAVRTVAPQGGLPWERAHEVTHVARIYHRLLEKPVPAGMLFTIEGEEMPLTVDSANAVAILAFTDDHGDPVPAPAGTLAVAASDNTAVLTVGAAVAGTDAAGNATITFPLTEVAEGTANLSVTATDANGNPLLGPDGSTPIATPAPVAVTVNPGAAADEVFTVPGN